MELIRKTKITITKNGNRIQWAMFLCPYCLKEVERQLSHGKRDKSCGCHINVKHGETGTRIYKIWDGMKQRILNPKTTGYKYYGGRGITICPEWTDKLNGYINFRDWALNNGYTDNLTIDRIENDLGYYPDNCQWITPKENIRKQKQVKLNIEIAKEIRYLYNTGNYAQRDLGKKYNVDHKMISCIINNKNWK